MTVNLNDEREWQRLWGRDPELRDEFLDDVESYLAYMRAEAEGLIQYPDLEKYIAALSRHPNRDLLIVRRFAELIKNRKAAKASREHPHRAIAEALFKELAKKLGRPPQAKELSRTLEGQGIKIKPKTIQNWLTDFKRDYFPPLTG